MSKSPGNATDPRGGGGTLRPMSPAEVQDALHREGAVALHRALGLVRDDGGAAPGSRRKIKQIGHLIRTIEPAIRDAFERHDEPVIVDAAAGKSYLGLTIYELFVRPLGRGSLIGVESRSNLVERCRSLAAELEFERAEFRDATIEDAALPDRVHLLVALHACDTATDAAIIRAVRASADHIAVVPCCQAEVARLLADSEVDEPALTNLWGTAWHRREFGAHLTNVVRTLALRAVGYQVSVTELTGWEHSLKNELLIGRRVGAYHAPSQRELAALLDRFDVRPWLVSELGDRLFSHVDPSTA